MHAHASRFEVFLGAVRAECRSRKDHFLKVVTPGLLHAGRIASSVGGHTELREAVRYVYERFDHNRWLHEGSVTSDLSRLVWKAYRSGGVGLSDEDWGAPRRDSRVLGVRAVYEGLGMFDANPASIRAGSVPCTVEHVNHLAEVLDGELCHDHRAYVTARFVGGEPVECAYVAVPGTHTRFLELHGFPAVHALPRCVRVLRVDGDMVTTGVQVRVAFDADCDREYECFIAVRSACVASARVARTGRDIVYVRERL